MYTFTNFKHFLLNKGYYNTYCKHVYEQHELTFEEVTFKYRDELKHIIDSSLIWMLCKDKKTLRKLHYEWSNLYNHTSYKCNNIW